jgi:tRNA U34 2-thiouridine synthase MnmA/TrmU
MSENKKSRGLGIFSGGLDSMLAVKVLERAGVEVGAVTFATPFFSPERAIISARHIKVPLQVAQVGEPHLELVKAPPHGYGSNMNPCIDCHAFMFERSWPSRGSTFCFPARCWVSGP